MKKVLLTEQQVNMLMNKVVDEQVPATQESEYSIDDGRYRMKCEFRFDFGYEGLTVYKGGEIESIDDILGEVTFSIDVQSESYGIRGLNVIDIKGPQSLQTHIRFYPEGVSSEDDDWFHKRIEEVVTIPLDWRKMEIDDFGHNMNYIGVGKRVSVDVVPDGKGGLMSKKIEVQIKNLKFDEE